MTQWIPLTFLQAGLEARLSNVLLPAIQPNAVLGEVPAEGSCCGGFQLGKKMQAPQRQSSLSAGEAFPTTVLCGRESGTGRWRPGLGLSGRHCRARPTLPSPPAEPSGRCSRGDQGHRLVQTCVCPGAVCACAISVPTACHMPQFIVWHLLLPNVKQKFNRPLVNICFGIYVQPTLT